MRLEILHIPGCPNVDLLKQRLDQALAEHAEQVERVDRVIDDLASAQTWGMTGSPTLLVDGVALRQALGLAGTAGGSVAGSLRDWRARAVPTDSGERGVHQAILRSFADEGHATGLAELEQVAAHEDAAGVLRRRHAADAIRLGPDDAVYTAYPFSAIPTRHRVLLPTGVQVYAMCMIDALGIPVMLDTDAVITTTDPLSAARITVTVTAGRFAWSPATAAVFVGARPGGGPSADTCCDHLNAFTDHDRAASWSRAHPQVPGEILTPVQAQHLGARIFGDLFL